MQLYDPQRAQTVKFKGQDRAWHTFLTAQVARAAELKKDGGRGLRFLMEPSTSPLLGALRERLRAEFPEAKFTSYSSLAASGWQEASETAFAAQAEARHDLREADVIASLDHDLLAALPGTLHHQRAFADRRDPKAGEMNRLYSIESALTPTGASADHRLALKPSEMTPFALGLLGRVARFSKSPQLERFANLNPALPAPQGKFADALAADLVRAAGKSLVTVGERQPAAVHLVAIAINLGLGNGARTVRYTRSLLHDPDNGPKALAALAAEIKAGRVDTLVITAHNPVYGAPADLEFGALLAKVPNAIYLGYYEDETAAQTGWFVPLAHNLESWGDGLAHDGTVTFQQPLIAPLFNGVTQAELLASFFGDADQGSYGLLRASWDSRATALGLGERVPQAVWEKWISDGYILGTAQADELPADFVAIQNALPVNPSAATGLEAYFVADYKIWDGRFGNNAWLQELPDPVTKLTWENSALLSPATARKLNLNQNDLIDIRVGGAEQAGGRAVRAPVFIQPGQAADTLHLILGYGRTATAEQLSFERGYNATKIRTANTFWSTGGVEIFPVLDHTHELAQTQEHHSTGRRRDPPLDRAAGHPRRGGSGQARGDQGQRRPARHSVRSARV